MANSNNLKTSRAKKSSGKKSLKAISRGSGNSTVTWHDAATDLLHATITMVTLSGGALMFTRSSDGGAVGVRVYHDDFQLETLWAVDAEEIYEVLLNVYQALGGESYV